MTDVDKQIAIFILVIPAAIFLVSKLIHGIWIENKSPLETLSNMFF